MQVKLDQKKYSAGQCETVQGFARLHRTVSDAAGFHRTRHAIGWGRKLFGIFTGGNPRRTHTRAQK